MMMLCATRHNIKWLVKRGKVAWSAFARARGFACAKVPLRKEAFRTPPRVGPLLLELTAIVPLGSLCTGAAFHLISRHRHDHVALSHQPPEVQRVPLEQLVLRIKALKYPGTAAEVPTHGPFNITNSFSHPRFAFHTTHARTHAPTDTPWFTITGTHTFTTSGTRTLMSYERVDQVDSHGRWKGPCLQTNPQCDPVSQHHLHHVDESTPFAPR
jgi:hypothetical protein